MKWTNALKYKSVKTHTRRDNLKMSMSKKLRISSSKTKAPGPDGLASEFYKMLMEEIMPLSHNLSLRIETEGDLTPNLFCQVSIILILNPKTLQETTKMNITHEHRRSQQRISK